MNLLKSALDRKEQLQQEIRGWTLKVVLFFKNWDIDKNLILSFTLTHFSTTNLIE